MKNKVLQRLPMCIGSILVVVLLSCQNKVVLKDGGKEILSGAFRDIVENGYDIPYQGIGESIANLWGIGNLMCGITTDAGRTRPYNILVNYPVEVRYDGYTATWNDQVYGAVVELTPTNNDVHNVQLKARTIRAKRFPVVCQADSGSILIEEDGRIKHHFQNLQKEDPRLDLTIHEVGHCLGLAHPSKVDECTNFACQRGKAKYYRDKHPAWLATGGNSGPTGNNAYRPVMDGYLLGNFRPSSWEKEAVQELFSKDGASTTTLQRHNQIRDFLRTTIIRAETDRNYDGVTNIFCPNPDNAGSGSCEGYLARWRVVEGVAVHDGLLSQGDTLVELQRNNQRESLYLDSLFSSENEATTKAALASTGALNTHTLGQRSVSEQDCINLYIAHTSFLENGGNWD